MIEFEAIAPAHANGLRLVCFGFRRPSEGIQRWNPV